MIHRPMPGPWESWPTHWRGDRGIMERICTHGTGHPVAESWGYLPDYELIHGCCGCPCAPKGDEVVERARDITAYISIGNSDDKLTQLEWSEYVHDVRSVLNELLIHGFWTSGSTERWQNAVWCVEVPGPAWSKLLKLRLQEVAKRYRQDSIAWAEVKDTEFLKSI